MRFGLGGFIVICLLFIIVGWYIYRAITARAHRRRLWHRVFAGVATAFGASAVVIMAVMHPQMSDATFNLAMWMMLLFFSIGIAALIFTVVDLLARFPVIFGHQRLKPVSVAGIVLGVVAFGGMWWGAFFNRYHISVNRVDVEVAELPEAFDGFTIAQISDLHISSFKNNPEFVDRLVDSINSLNPDVIVFTGDIVSRHADELQPFTSTLARLSAPCGQYAVAGNHDYADYYGYDSDELRAADCRRLRELYATTALTLLDDTCRYIHRGADSIAIIGVQNIGMPPFKTYGSLERAYPCLADSTTKILLSHDPSHWANAIADNDTANVALTLSGHTHASQVNILGVSPGSLMHPYNDGLYHDASRRHAIYVNHGIGTVGIPMRLGAAPEITLISLRRK